ncbi:MAG: CBS domain-containing protein [Candidatus Thermoplasmatota archaeon]
MTRNVVTVNADQTALEAAEIYRDKKVGCLVVVENGICVGILTERDIIERVLCRELEPRRTKVREIMSHPIKTVFALDTIEKALQIMKENHIKKLPVISNDTIVGIITVTDISHARSELTKRFIESWVKPRWID